MTKHKTNKSDSFWPSKDLKGKFSPIQRKIYAQDSSISMPWLFHAIFGIVTSFKPADRKSLDPWISLIMTMKYSDVQSSEFRPGLMEGSGFPMGYCEVLFWDEFDIEPILSKPIIWIVGKYQNAKFSNFNHEGVWGVMVYESYGMTQNTWLMGY